MDANTIITAINAVGFPIFCVLALGVFIYKRDIREREDRKEHEDTERQEREKVNEMLTSFSLNLAKNTDAIVNLTEYIKKTLEGDK